MTLVIGRGNRRQTIELPCGEMVQRSEKNDPKTHRESILLLCEILGINP